MEKRIGVRITHQGPLCALVSQQLSGEREPTLPLALRATSPEPTARGLAPDRAAGRHRPLCSASSHPPRCPRRPRCTGQSRCARRPRGPPSLSSGCCVYSPQDRNPGAAPEAGSGGAAPWKPRDAGSDAAAAPAGTAQLEAVGPRCVGTALTLCPRRRAWPPSTRPCTPWGRLWRDAGHPQPRAGQRGTAVGTRVASASRGRRGRGRVGSTLSRGLISARAPRSRL